MRAKELARFFRGFVPYIAGLLMVFAFASAADAQYWTCESALCIGYSWDPFPCSPCQGGPTIGEVPEPPPTEEPAPQCGQDTECTGIRRIVLLHDFYRFHKWVSSYYAQYRFSRL